MYGELKPSQAAQILISGAVFELVGLHSLAHSPTGIGGGRKRPDNKEREARLISSRFLWVEMLQLQVLRETEGGGGGGVHHLLIDVLLSCAARRIPEDERRADGPSAEVTTTTTSAVINPQTLTSVIK